MHALTHFPEHESAPRGKPIKELIGASFTLTNPRNRLILSPTRNVNYGFAVGELCWYIRGDDDLATMLYYNKRMAAFSDNGISINSAYGARIFNKIDWQQKSQFDNVVAELTADPDSRRAVIHINDEQDLMRATKNGSKDVPCTMSLQLFIRDKLLHMHVLMRSNDVVWGLPYDVFSFTCLQELFLYALQDAGAPVNDLGSYHHTIGSLHVYDTHYDMANLIAAEITDDPVPMASFDQCAMQTLAEEDELAIREGRWTDVVGTPAENHYNDSVAWMFKQLVDHKNKRLNEEKQKKESEQT